MCGHMLLFLCMCVYICVFCILLHVEVRGECWLSFSTACTLFFETGFLIKFSLSLPIGLGWLTSFFRTLPVPMLHYWDYRCTACLASVWSVRHWTQGSSWLTPILPAELLLKSRDWSYRKHWSSSDYAMWLSSLLQTSWRMFASLSSTAFWIAGWNTHSWRRYEQTLWTEILVQSLKDSPHQFSHMQT